MEFDQNYDYEKEDKDALIQKYLAAKLGPQPEEDLESIRNKQNQNVQLQRDAAGANLMSGLNNASAMIGGGYYKPDNSDLEASNKDRQGQISANNQQMAAGQKQAGDERKNAVNEYLSGKRKDAELKQSAENNTATNNRIRDDATTTANRQIEIAKIMAAGRSGTADSKHDQNNIKDFVTLEHEMNFGPSRGGQDFQSHKKIKSSADRILGLGLQGETQKDGGLTTRQIHEIAIASAALVGGSSGAAQGTIDALVPHSEGTVEARVQEWLTNEPKGANQQAFVKQMLETAEREKHIASEKIKDYNAKSLSTYEHLRDADPDLYERKKVKYLGPDAQIDDYGNYVQKEFSVKPDAVTSKGNSDAEKYAKMHSIPLDQATAIINMRKQKTSRTGGL